MFRGEADFFGDESVAQALTPSLARDRLRTHPQVGGNFVLGQKSRQWFDGAHFSRSTLSTLRPEWVEAPAAHLVSLQRAVAVIRIAMHVFFVAADRREQLLKRLHANVVR